MKRLLSLILISGLMIGFAACSSSDDNAVAGDDTPLWIGTWLSAGADIAPLLAGDPFNLDSVRVEFKEDNTVTTSQHVIDGAWLTYSGVYAVTESATGDIHSIYLTYPAFEQSGIFQVTAASPNRMQFEAIQVVPDYGFVPRTPETGFGSDPLYGVLNVQWYSKIVD